MGPGEVSQLEEATARMGPAECLGHGTAGTGRFVEAAEAGIRVGLQDAGVAGEMLLGMLATTIRRIVEEGRRPSFAKGAIVTDIGP